jgi:serine/threonine protein kinase
MGEVGNLLGRVVAGKFMIEERVGGGAMGEVFRARHVVLDTVIAVKIMRADIAKDPMFKERFYREAKAASRLDHPNSVRVLDFGVEADGLVYLAMEFLHGRDLLSVVREEWPLPDERVIDILAQALAAVSVAHELGIVHRDLKPENIMINVGAEEDGARPYNVKVCDFGIAKLNDPRGFQTENGKSLTSRGMLIGTPEYMSPEQSRGDPLDARSDLYSLGVVLYQLLVGRVPFTAENAIGVLLKQINDEATAPSKVRPGVNPRLEAICMRALSKSRDDRYQTAKEMRRDLRNVAGYRAPSMHDESSDSVVTRSDAPDAASAPTLAYPDASRGDETARSSDPDFSPKDTSHGTELTVPVTQTHRYVTVLVALSALALAALVISLVFFRSPNDASTRDATGADASPSASAPGSVAALGASGTRILEEPAANKHAGVPATKSATPSTSAIRGGAAHGTVGTGATTGAPSTSTSTSTTSTSTPSASTSTGTTTGGAAAVAGGPPYNPAGAHVALGALTVERVRADAVSRKMSEALPKLSECYRSALMMAGAPVAGSAEIHMSIDEKGNIRAPIVNAPKHPHFARCAQQALAGMSVPVSALEEGASAGANAAQWLTLHP